MINNFVKFNNLEIKNQFILPFGKLVSHDLKNY